LPVLCTIFFIKKKKITFESPKSPYAMECYYNFKKYFTILFMIKKYPLNFQWILIILMTFGISSMGHAQKDKDIIPTIDCIKYTGNGLYQASFGYENPTKKEVVIDENGSIIKSNNGKRVAKGLNKFQPGTNTKVFTKEFSANDYVEWTIISNGNEHTIVVNANGAKCAPDDGGFIFPVYGQGNGKSEEIIGQELTALADNTAGDIPSKLIFQITNEKVLIEIVPNINQFSAVILLLKNTYGLSYNIDPLLSDFILDPDANSTLAAIDVYFPIARLLELNLYTTEINFVRPLYPVIKNSVGDGFTGNAVTQGDATQGSDVVRESFRLINEAGTVLPVDGTGITIGVMSNSYDTQNKASIDVEAGDLPGPGTLNEHGYKEPVEVIKEYPYGTASDEGRAMMHIIHDVAPGAKLAFHTGSLSPRNFEVGFKALAGFNESNELIDTDLGLKSNLIVDDITFITEPFFGEGRISAAIKAFSLAGGTHFTSAGNFADDGYQAIFNATTSAPTTSFLPQGSPATAHIFDNTTGDYLQKISVKGGETYMIVLQWDDSSASQNNLNGTDIDLDFYIVNDAGRLLVGNNRSNEDGDAAEIMVFTASADGEANILITSANGATNVPFRYIAFQSNGLTLIDNNEGAPTISGHAMTDESVTVGAIRFNKDVPESFSSFGGTLSDGNSVTVDFAAPDGVNTNVISIGTRFYADGTSIDGDAFPNFFGTSAAAPSAAAAVALLQSALPTWYPGGYTGDVIQLFKDNVNLAYSTDDVQAGAGMIDVNKVFNSLASQTARITSFDFVSVPDSIPSIDEVKIKIIGDYFPAPAEGEPNSVKVYLDGVELIGTIQTDGSIEVIIPPFSGNPDLQVYTEPKEGSEGNGGYSEPYQFFQDGKIALTVKANPADTVNDDGSITQNPVTILYGQEYKSKLTYHVKGVPEGGFVDTNGDPTTFEDIFPTVVFTTNVDNEQYPSAYIYSVTPSFDDTYDTDKFIVNFVNGDLVVEKNYLTIKPENKTFKYGDIITNTLVYQVTDEDGNAISETEQDLYGTIADFYAAIGNAHQEDFYYDDFGEGNTESLMLLINDFNQNTARFGEIETLLENGSWISSKNSILNGLIRQSAVINGLRTSALINGLRTSALINGEGNVNGFRISALMNTLRIDKSYFTNYIDYTALNNTRQLAIMNDDWIVGNEDEDRPSIEEILNGLRTGAIMNDYNRMSAIMNGTRVGAIMNALDVFDLNVDVKVNDAISRDLGIENGTRQLAVMNGLRTSAVINGLRQSAIINGTRQGAIINDKVFSLIDYTDAPYDSYTDSDGVESSFDSIQKFYSLNLITGVDVTNGVPHLIFPGAFLNDMAANFYIHYQKGNLTIEPGDLIVETRADLDDPEVDFKVNYGTILTDKDIPTTFATVDTNFELIEAIFPDGIPYYFKKVGGDDTQYTLGGPIKMDVGVYNIFITDVEDNYTIKYGDNHGTLTITEATLNVVTTTASNIKYGATPEIVTLFNEDDFADGENASTLFPEAQGGIPYFFMKQGETPDSCVDCTKYYLPYLTGEAKMDVGIYNIFITDDPTDNYIIEFAAERGTLTVEPATLTVKTTAFEVEYGDLVSDAIETSIEGFANEEVLSDIFPDGSGGTSIPYLFVKGTDAGLDIDTVKELGTYTITVTAPTSGNYVIAYHATDHGQLTITEATLEFTPQTLTITYGDTPNVKPNFKGFGHEEDENVLVVDGTMPYYFMPGEYKVGDKMDVGLYDIFITDDLTDNYKFSDTKLGTLDIGKATLIVTISPEELIVNQGDTPALTTTFNSGDAYGEGVNDVFGAVVPYEFVDEFGDIFYDTSVPGVFTVSIEDPTNYVMAYTSDATLFVNPFNDDIKKVRTYADCVSYNGPNDYTVTYRYENDNDVAVFAALGADNNLSGPAAATASGTLPTIFMPGSGTFEINFNGDQLVWSLTTYEGTHKSSVSSASTSGSGECDAKLDGSYTLGPNPVTSILNITQNIVENSEVRIYNMYGSEMDYGSIISFNGTFETKEVNMSGFGNALYIVRIVSDTNVRTYNIIKQ
jgi:hypothetical protein